MHALDKLISEGEVFKPKNSTKYDEVIAYQFSKKDKIVMPDGILLKEGDFLCVPTKQKETLAQVLDRGELSTEVYSIKQSTMQKSYNMFMSRSNSNDGNGLEI